MLYRRVGVGWRQGAGAIAPAERGSGYEWEGHIVSLLRERYPNRETTHGGCGRK